MIAALLAAAFAWPTPMPASAPAPVPTVLWNGPPATSFTLGVEAYDVTADGDARVLVRALMHDERGATTHSRHGTDFDWLPSRGSAQWQTGLRFGGPAALISLRDEGAVTVRVVAHRPDIGTRIVHFDTRVMSLPHVVGAALGPHLVRVGWFPQVRSGAVRIFRVEANGRRTLAATVHAPCSSWDDAAVRPDTLQRYLVVRPAGGAAHAISLAVTVPAELPPSDAAVVRGKGAWLEFSGDPLDDDGYGKLDVEQIVATAKAAGVRYIELRLAYGAFDEVTPAAKPAIDRLIDVLDTAGIAVVGWTVPRALAADDLSRDAAVARYRTPAGHGITGLAVDVERGEEFLGTGAAGYAALRDYLRVLRTALGPHVLLAANVEDPFLENLDERSYPYAEIAASADVLQPMTYWRMLGAWDTPDKAQQAVTGSIERLRSLARRTIPIDVGVQTAPLSARGAPPAAELEAALAAGRRSGAAGALFYDWGATSPEQWAAIAATAW